MTNPYEIKTSVNPITKTIVLGEKVTFIATVNGGIPPIRTYTWILPSGCPVSNSPTITCTPTSVGTYNVSVTVLDSCTIKDNTASATATLIVIPKPIPLSVSLDINPSTITINQQVTYTITVTGGTSPYSYTWSNLPINCNGSNTNIIKCNPNIAGTYVTDVTVKDSSSNTVIATNTLVVNPISTAKFDIYTISDTNTTNLKGILIMKNNNGTLTVDEACKQSCDKLKTIN